MPELRLGTVIWAENEPAVAVTVVGMTAKPDVPALTPPKVRVIASLPVKPVPVTLTLPPDGPWFGESTSESPEDGVTCTPSGLPLDCPLFWSALRNTMYGPAAVVEAAVTVRLIAVVPPASGVTVGVPDTVVPVGLPVNVAIVVPAEFFIVTTMPGGRPDTLRLSAALNAFADWTDSDVVAPVASPCFMLTKSGERPTLKKPELDGMTFSGASAVLRLEPVPDETMTL